MTASTSRQGDIFNVTFRDIRVETRTEAPRWWGNGEWLSITVEPRYAGDQVGRVSGLHFDNIVARTENGGLLSGRAGAGVANVTMTDVDVTVTAGIGNYSLGHGPPCSALGKNISCLGTRDHRPSYVEDVHCTLHGNCRTPAKADGLFLENVHGVRLKRVAVRFVSPPGSTTPPAWFGECVHADNQSSGIVQLQSVCTRP